MDLNEVILLGRLGRDPESKELPTTKLTTFSVATTRKWKDGRGEWQEQTDWHDVKCFGKTAEIAAKLRKADKVLIKGALTVEQWEKDGETLGGGGGYTWETPSELTPSASLEATTLRAKESAQVKVG